MSGIDRRRFLALSAGAVLTRRASAAARLSSAALAQLHRTMAGYVERGELPGLVTLIGRGSEVRADAVGKQAVGGAPMRRDTIFRIASMSKPITAAAAMILVEQGKLRLDEPVDRLLPELANRKVLERIDGPLDQTVPARRPISVRDLLTLRMGLGLILAPPGKFPIQKAMKEQEVAIPTWPGMTSLTPDQWIRHLGALPLVHQPGETWMYHTGSDVLGVLIARASGQPFEAFLGDRIFGPLGMKDTAFSVPAAKLPRFAAGYSFDHQKKALALFDAPGGQWSHPPSFPAGGAGLVSTVDDYAAFAGMMLGKGKHGKARILSAASVEAMTTNQLTPQQAAAAAPLVGPSTGWGFGLSVLTAPDRFSPAPGRYGWNGGLGTSWWSDPAQQLTAIILTQRMFESAEPPPVCADFWTAAYQAAGARRA